MPFETLSPRLLNVATSAVAHCRQHFGTTGYHLEEEIDGSIAWRPTFYLRPNKLSIIAVEVADKLYPDILKLAAHDIGHYNAPITVYQACPLDVFQADKHQEMTGLLREHGFGILTVDDNGRATFQFRAIPLAQHITPQQLEEKMKGLTSSLRAQFRNAHLTYHDNLIQGLQQASQIVEGMVGGLALQAAKRGLIRSPKPREDAADVIDLLWDCPQLKNYRAGFGSARGFTRNHRNAASHPAKSSAQAIERIRNCRNAFFAAVDVATELRNTAKSLRYSVKIYIP